jgi:arsenate reductase (thioredoxin)
MEVDMTTQAPSGAAAETATRKIRVLFVCTGNSARSQMAEAILRRDAGDRFEAFSGGADPRPINPLTVQVLDGVGIDISDAKSKPASRFLGQSFDDVITLCDRARVTCPIFPGGGQTLHWGLDDPAEVDGTEAEKLAAFRRSLTEVSMRIRDFIPLATVTAR